MKEKTRDEFHREYGGRMHEEDFGERITLAEMAARIAQDIKFDRILKKKMEEKNSGGISVGK